MSFIIAGGKQKNRAELVSRPGAKSAIIEAQGKAFGDWLLENGSTSLIWTSTFGKEPYRKKADSTKPAVSGIRMMSFLMFPSKGLSLF